MGTSKADAEKILSQVQTIADARIRPMMGEYILYVNDKVAGQINEGVFFIKITPFGEDFAKELDRQSPYPGAKPAFVVPANKIQNQSWLHDFITGTVEQLPAPRKK